MDWIQKNVILAVLCVCALIIVASLVLQVFYASYLHSAESSVGRMMAPADDLVPDLTSGNRDRVCEAISGLYSKYHRVSEDEAIAAIVAGNNAELVDSLYRSIIKQLFDKNPRVMLSSLDYCIENNRISLTQDSSREYVYELIDGVPHNLRGTSEIYKNIVKLLD